MLYLHNIYLDPMVYCGSGTETAASCVPLLYFLILWSTAEAVLRRNSNSHNFVFLDPMVYCGSGTETKFIAIILF